MAKQITSENLGPQTATLASTLANRQHAFVDYSPGKGDGYEMLLALGPRDTELSLAVFQRHIAITVDASSRDLHEDYLASKIPPSAKGDSAHLATFLNAVLAALGK